MTDRPLPAPDRAAPAHSAGGFDWKRFIVRSLVLIALFNVAAFLVTWYYILPRLHPALNQ